MMPHLAYPVFAARPPFYRGPAGRRRWLDDGIRLLYLAFVWAYTSLMEPSTYGDCFSHIGELSAIILGSMWLLGLSRRQLAGECGGDRAEFPDAMRAACSRGPSSGLECHNARTSAREERTR